MNANQPLVSIIIPIYNVEKYLERCVKSVIEQSYTNLEIFLVDDGSPDNSGAIADSLAKNDKRIKVIHQKNKGLSGARNTGIKQATGEWIMFVDSDDFIDSDMVKTMLNIAIKNKAEIVACNVDRVSDDGHINYYGDVNECFTVDNKKALMRLARNNVVNNSVNNKFIKTSIVKGALFKEGIVFEDCDIMYKWIYKANIFSYTGKPFYKYYMSPQSLLRGKVNPKLFDYLDIAKEKLSFYEKYCYEATPTVKANIIEELLFVAYRTRKEKQYKDKNSEVIDYVRCLIKENQYIPYSKKNKFKIRCFKIGKHFYYFMMSMYERLFRRY